MSSHWYLVVKGSGRKKGNTGTGTEVIKSRFIEINSVEASGYQMNGIGVVGGGDVRILHAYVHDNGYNGIEVTGEWGKKSVHNVYIGHCVAENNVGCPIILDNHSASGINIMRYNVSINDGIKNSQAGIYVWCDPYNKDTPLCDTKVHDNLIISNQGYSISYNTGFSSGLEFVNNTFILTNEGVEHLHGDETKSMAIYRGSRFWSEAAELKDEAQPQVSEDCTASYEKVEYALPKNIDILRLKEIISDMFV